MASIQERPRTDGTVGYAVLFRHGKKQTSVTYNDEESAIKAKAALDAGVDSALLFDRPEVINDKTVREILEFHFKTITDSTDRTVADYERDAENHVYPTLGDLPGRMVGREEAADWAKECGKKMSAKTFANIRGMVSTAWNKAIEENWVTKNPFRGVSLPRDDHEVEEMVVFTRDEYRRLSAWVGENKPEYQDFVDGLTATGARFSELTALDALMVQPDGRKVTIKKAHKRQPDSTRKIGPTKTKRSKRTITISRHYAPTLVRLTTGRPRSALVYVSPDGAAIDHSNFRNRCWTPAITYMTVCPDHQVEHKQYLRELRKRIKVATGETEAALRQELKDKKLPEPCGCPGYMTRRARIHDLRHTHVAWLIAAGVSLAVIQARLGHESITTTINTYGHLLPDIQEDAAESISDVWDRPAIEAASTDDVIDAVIEEAMVA